MKGEVKGMFSVKLNIYGFFVRAAGAGSVVGAVAVASLLACERTYILVAIAGVWAVLCVTALIYAVYRIDFRLALYLWPQSQSIEVFAHEFPNNRLVDLHFAARDYCAAEGFDASLNSSHQSELRSLIALRVSWWDRRIHRAKCIPRAIDEAQEVYVPVDEFWIRTPWNAPGHNAAIVRVWYDKREEETWIEIAAEDKESASAIHRAIRERADQNSIYKNKVIEAVVMERDRDPFDLVECPDRMILRFKKLPKVSEGDIIIEPHIRQIIRRNLFDFHRHKDAIKARGIPLKKGLLFYGPPGTGKTYTCRYIYSELADITTLIITGHALKEIKSVCRLARTLQPSLVVLEDVDLVFSSRADNFYSTSLGDLMDQLDGFNADDAVIFILTTNDMVRLESAIKDRPGRINQCIFFGTPSPDVRRRDFLQSMSAHDHAALDLDKWIAKTEGCSHAFIKELIFRAVQVSMEETGYTAGVLHLKDADFQKALDELTSFDDRKGHAILGFRAC